MALNHILLGPMGNEWDDDMGHGQEGQCVGCGGRVGKEQTKFLCLCVCMFVHVCVCVSDECFTVLCCSEGPHTLTHTHKAMIKRK